MTVAINLIDLSISYSFLRDIPSTDNTIMKLIKILFFILISTLTTAANAQVNYLRLSPNQKIEQTVGATTVKLQFSRPQIKGRKIFGTLVPYGKLWRTGANENTKISFSHRVKIGDKIIQPGTYALFTKPMPSTWEVYFYADTSHFGVPDPIDTSKLTFLTEVQPNTVSDLQETLVINFYNITETSVNLGINWENTEVLIPIEFYTREAMENAMDIQFQKNALDYSIAASYYAERNIELEKAKKLQELSIELRDKPSPWAYNGYGVILQKLGELQEAIKAIEYSIELAKQTNHNYLIKVNEGLLREWQN